MSPIDETLPQSRLAACQPPHRGGQGGIAAVNSTVNNNLSDYEILTDLRIAPMAPFSSLDTWAWEMPRWLATSIWVLPS